jgi:hypothetical protein
MTSARRGGRERHGEEGLDTAASMKYGRQA